MSETPRDGSPERVSRVWYGWDGDRLTTTRTDTTRVQTVYLPGTFTPLLRIGTATAELNKFLRRSLAEKLQQDGGVTFPAELVTLLDRLESELLNGSLSEQSQQWLARCGLTAERMQNQLEPVHTPQRTIHLYHCDHRGLPLAPINEDGKADWSAEYDAWGNVLNENNPHGLVQHLRLPGQQYDEETGLHYNRHRYYDPRQGRYITQDPIGLRGGWNLYVYPLNPATEVDPLGQATVKIDGKKITVHNNVVDPWPSNPHGHIYDKNEVIDKDGRIYNKSSGKVTCSLSKKSLSKWLDFLKKIGKLSIVGDAFMLHDLVFEEAKEACAQGDYGMCGVLDIIDGKKNNPYEA